MMTALAIALLVWACATGAFLVVCWLGSRHHEHEWQIEFTPSTIFLSCRCGVISPGWRIFEPPPGCERLTTRTTR